MACTVEQLRCHEINYCMQSLQQAEFKTIMKAVWDVISESLLQQTAVFHTF